MKCKVRVRGIYATALTKFLLDRGYLVVQPSDIIVQRFKIDNPSYAPPDITIKDSERVRGALTIIGKGHALDEFLRDLAEFCDEFVLWRSKIPLHTVVKAVVKRVESNRVVFDLGNNIEGVLPTLSAPFYRVGDSVAVTVVRTAVFDNEEIVVSTDIRVDGEYASLIPGGRVVLSKHIRDPEKRTELLSLGLRFLDKLGGLGIKWRSSAQYADVVTLIQELESLLSRLEHIRERVNRAQPYEVIQEGQHIAEVILGGRLRSLLDDVRNSVIPTVKNHHSLKLFSRKATIIDYTEHILSFIPDRRDDISNALIDYIYGKLNRVVIYHVKPDGSTLRIGPGQLLVWNRGELFIKRRLRPGGLLDGLDIPKEEGDYAITHVKLGSTYIVHAYFNKNKELKGVYVNINTEVEPVRGGVMYVDLYVDVVKRGDSEEIRVIDEDQLEQATQRGVIKRSLYDKAMSTVRRVIESFDNIVRPCLDINEEMLSEYA